MAKKKKPGAGQKSSRELEVDFKGPLKEFEKELEEVRANLRTFLNRAEKILGSHPWKVHITKIPGTKIPRAKARRAKTGRK
jgi:hypothetical protein